MNPWEVIARCQGVLAEYLPPGGVSEKQVISDLLGILDDQELIAAQCAVDEK